MDYKDQHLPIETVLILGSKVFFHHEQMLFLKDLESERTHFTHWVENISEESK